MREKSDSTLNIDHSLDNITTTDTIIRVSGNPNRLNEPIKQYITASFIRRLFARFIDLFILGFITCIFIFIGIIVLVSTHETEINQYVVDVCTNYTREEVQNDTVCNSYFSKNLKYFDYAIIGGYVVYIAYFIILPTTNFQSTLGKKLLKVSIVDKTHLTKINFFQAIIREIFWIFAIIIILLNRVIDKDALKYIDSVSFILILISIIPIPFNQLKQAWHDKLASTLVVKELTKNISISTVNK